MPPGTLKTAPTMTMGDRGRPQFPYFRPEPRKRSNTDLIVAVCAAQSTMRGLEHAPPGHRRCPCIRDVTEIDRTVSASGNVSLGDHVISAGLPLAGQRVTLRLDGPVAHVLAGGVLAGTVTCPVPPEARPRLRGARPGIAQPPRLPEPLAVTRRVSVRGAIMISGQRIQAGPPHVGKTVQVSVGPDACPIAVEPGITVTAARTGSRDIRRHKASNYG
jgi:hypothetical protein